MASGLTVKLGGDTAELTKALQSAQSTVQAAAQQINSRLKSIDDTTKKIGESGFTRLQANIVTLNQGFALLQRGVSAVQSVFRNTIGAALDAGDNFSKLSQKVGVSVENLSSLALAADLSDVSLEQMGTGLRFLNRSMVEADTASSKAAKTFKALGIETRDSTGAYRNSNDVLLDLAKSFAGAADSAGKTTAATILFGRAGADLIPLLNQGSEAIKEQQRLSKELGLTWTTETARGAEEFNDTLNLIGKGITGVSTQIAIALLPDLRAGAKATFEWIQANREFIATRIVETLEDAAKFARELLPLMRDIAGAIGGLVGLYNSLPAIVKDAGIVGAVIGGTAGFLIAGKVGAVIGALSALSVTIHGLVQGMSVDPGPRQFADDIDFIRTAGQGAATTTAALGVEVKKTGDETKKSASNFDTLGKLLDTNKEKTDKAANAAKRLAETQAEARAEALKEIEAYKLISSGTLTLFESMARLATAQLAVKINSKDIAETYRKEKQAADDYADTVKLITKLDTDLKKVRDDEARQLKERLITGKETLKDLTDEAAILQANIANHGKYADALKAVALMKIANAEATGKLTKEEAELQRQILRGTLAVDKLDDKLKDLNNTNNSVTVDFREAWNNVFNAIVSGTRDLGDFFKGFGLDLARQFGEAFIFGKGGSFDKPFQLNVNQLLGFNGVIPGIFGDGGLFSANSFASSFFSGLSSSFSSTGGQGQFANVISGGSSTAAAAGSLWGTIFGTVAAGAAGLTFGSFFSEIVGLTSKNAKKGGLIGGGLGGIGGAIVGSFFGPGGMELGALVGSFFGNIVGSFFGSLFKPGRIAQEKKDAEKFFQEIFEGVNFKVFKEKKVAEAFGSFDTPSGASTQALGALFAKDFGDKATQGTIIRFAGQFLANLKDMGLSADEAKTKILELAQAMGFELGSAIGEINSLTGDKGLLSLSEFEEEIKEARKNLKEYGDTSELTANQLSKLATENGNTGSKLVTYNELVAGAISLATGFNEAVDAQALANSLLADRFTEVGLAAGVSGDRIAGLSSKIADGSLSIEEAVLALNDMRESAGLAKLSLEDFTLDPEQVVEAVGIIMSALEGLANFGEGLAGLLESGINAALAGQEVNFRENFDDFFDATLRTAIVKAMIAGFIQGTAIEMLRPLFEKVTTLITQLATKAITPEEFAAQFKATIAENKDLIEALRVAFGTVGEEVLQFLADIGILPDILDDATGSANELVNKFKELNAQIEEIARKRIEVQIDLITKLGQIGVLTPLQVIDARLASIQSELTFFQNIGSDPNQDRPMHRLSDAQLTRGLEVLQQASDLAVERYNAEVAGIQAALQSQIAAINAALQAQLESIRAEFAAKRDAVQKTIQHLQDEKTAVQELFQTRIEGLREELRVAEEFKRVAEQLQQQINSLVVSPQSSLSTPEQLAFLQRQAQGIRNELKTAPVGEQADLIQKLAGILQQQLSVRSAMGQGPSDALFVSIIKELERLRDRSGLQGDKAADIQQQILDAELAMKSSLASIDAQIVAQQDYLTALSQQEQAAISAAQAGATKAIEAAQAAADLAIKDLRDQTAQTLRDLAAKRDEYLVEQIRRLEEQKEITKQQLIEQFGAEEAERLLADPARANLLALGAINTSLGDIKTVLGDFLSTIKPTARGYEGVVARPQLRLIGEAGPEYVSIRPLADMRSTQSGGGNVSVYVSVPENFMIRVDGGSNPAQAGQQAGKAFIDAIIFEAKNGRLGAVIDERARRARP